MDSAEFTEWIAYYSIEPFGEEWAQAGMISSTIANAARDPKKKKEPFMPDDFMPGKKSVKRPTANELLDKVKMINRMMGGKDKTGGK